VVSHEVRDWGADGVQAMDNFFQTVYQAVLRLLPFQTLKAIVIASPGFTKDSVRPDPHLALPVAPAL
jgi:stalled ribosome rescue protein Dom34